MEDPAITVTSPLLPSLDDLNQELQKIWESRYITNNGTYHKKFERAVADYLGAPYVSLFANGTLALFTALRALKISGDVITTPYTFVATTHALNWNGINPVFADVDPVTGNLDPYRIEEAITPRTTAILPVHVYGTPCDTRRIREIADRHGLRVLYDGAHGFGVRTGEGSLLNEGDMSIVSFHATKVFNTVEGGAVIMHDREMKQQIDYMKNFGFANETTIVTPGINCKLDEIRSAYGLVNLRQVDWAIDARKSIALRYREELKEVEGISFLSDVPGVRHNYAYFPIFIDAAAYGMERDELYSMFRSRNILCRRYFFPLVSEVDPYTHLDSARPDNIPNAVRLSKSVICLPIHPYLSDDDLGRVIEVIKNR